MQELLSSESYYLRMPQRKHQSLLRKLREAAGLSQRELAEQIGEHHSNVGYWEASGKTPRSDLLVPIAKTLGITVEELLGSPKPRSKASPAGKVRQTFETVSKLPRRQQDKIIDVVNALIAQHSNGK